MLGTCIQTVVSFVTSLSFVFSMCAGLLVWLFGWDVAWGFYFVAALAGLADMVSGTWAAKVSGETILSKTFFRKLPRLIMYAIGIMLFHHIETVFNFSGLIFGFTFAIVAGETISFLENVIKGTKNTAIKERLEQWLNIVTNKLDIDNKK